MGYAAAAIVLKRALIAGAGAMQVTIAGNLAMALVALCLWPPFAAPAALFPWWQPALLGGLFYLGQIFTFLSLARGDVSVATPLLGAKVVFVVLFVSLFGGSLLPLTWWLAALLCFAGIVLVGSVRGTTALGGRFAAAVNALLAAACFGLTDALFQFWAPAEALAVFAPTMFGFLGIVTLLHGVLFHRQAFLPPPSGALAAFYGGVLVLAVQAMGVAVAISHSGDAAAVNIVYGSRALLGVLLVWLAGKTMGLTEASMGWKGILLRALGALLITLAIAIALWPHVG